MHGYKTFIIAVLMVVVAFASLYYKMIEAPDFMKILASVSGMIGLREIGDKLLTKG